MPIVRRTAAQVRKSGGRIDRARVVRTVQQWEQGRAVPDRPARILLRVIDKMPEAVAKALA